MFYISLPYFYQNYKFNNFFKDYVEKSHSSKNSKLIAKFNIEYFHGAFPWSLWNGGVNSHSGKAVLTPEMELLFQNTLAPIRIDASNINLQPIDYLDLHENAVLKTMNGTNSVYEISLLDIVNHLQNSNLNNKYIISNNAQLIHPFDPDILEAFYQEESICLVNLGYRPIFNLSDITDKTKLEISIGHCDNCSLELYSQCIINENTNIYNYSGESCFINCCHENKITNYYEAILPYYKQGITHFKIMTNCKDLNEFNINIIKSFVKPEYVGECIDEYYRTIQ